MERYMGPYPDMVVIKCLHATPLINTEVLLLDASSRRRTHPEPEAQ